MAGDITTDSRLMPAMEKPVPFIQTLKDGTLQVNEDISYVMSQSKHPVSVIAIVGKYRTGKSYIMNRFFESNSGFNLGPTIQSTTKGIWMWAKPHPQDPKKTLILLDTEGLHDVEKGDETHDMQLFCLSILLSSCLVYNATGTLDDILIQQLHLVSQLTEHIQTKKDKDEDGNHFNNYFPSFVVLLRDFYLDLKIDGKERTPNEYLENALKLKVGKGRKINEYNEPRECIRAFFPRRQCFTLCKPVDNDEDLKQIDTLSEDKIKPEFLQKAAECTQAILNEAGEFKVDNNPINGSRFMELARMYVECINKGRVPCISNTVDLLRKNECQRGLDEAMEVYGMHFKDLIGQMPLSEHDLTKEHKIAAQKALNHYSATALFEEEGSYFKKLGELIETTFKKNQGINMEKSREKCLKIIHSCFKTLDENIVTGAYIGKGGYQKYLVDRKNAIDQFEKYPSKGPAAQKTITTYLEGRKSEEDNIINADKALDKKEKELAKEAEARKRAAEKAKVSEEENKRLVENFYRQQNEHQQMLLKMQNDFQERQNDIMKEHAKDMKEKEMEYQRLMNEGLGKQADQYKSLLESMKEDKEKAELQFGRQMEEMKNYRKQHEDLIKQLQQQKDVNIEHMQALQAKLDALQEKNDESWCSVM